MNYISPKIIFLFLIACASGVFSPALLAQTTFTPNNNQGAPRIDEGWPRKFVNGTTSFSVYQPQIEQWHGNQIEARAAAAIANGQSKQTTYGVLWFTARTEIDKINRVVTMTDFRITKVHFPAATDKANVYQELMQQQVPKAGQVIALDRLLADLATSQAEDENTDYQLKNDPPQIFFSTRPAILILIDGKPRLRPVNDTKLQRVINTRVLILRDESNGKFYLHLMDGWMESVAATGPWMIAPKTARSQSRGIS